MSDWHVTSLTGDVSGKHGANTEKMDVIFYIVCGRRFHFWIFNVLVPMSSATLFIWYGLFIPREDGGVDRFNTIFSMLSLILFFKVGPLLCVLLNKFGLTYRVSSSSFHFTPPTSIPVHNQR